MDWIVLLLDEIMNLLLYELYFYIHVIILNVFFYIGYMKIIDKFTSVNQLPRDNS